MGSKIQTKGRTKDARRYTFAYPGILRIRPRNSLSQVATMKHLHCLAI